MARSAIEAMIDKACGVPEGWTPEPVNGHDADNDWLILFCPGCGRFVATERQPIDPFVATMLELLCDSWRCWEEGSECFYYDGTGRELSAADWPTPATEPRTP